MRIDGPVLICLGRTMSFDGFDGLLIPLRFVLSPGLSCVVELFGCGLPGLLVFVVIDSYLYALGYKLWVLVNFWEYLRSIFLFSCCFWGLFLMD